MFNSNRSGSMMRRAFAVVTAPVALLAFSHDGSAADATVTNVSAGYRIQLAGVKFGSYTFSSKQDGNSYSVRSHAKLRAFFGAFKWRGSATSDGRMTIKGPRPQRYVYSYRKNRKAPRSITMTLARGDARQVTHNPPRPLNKPNRVPLTKAHFESVKDPMSALMSLSAPANGSNPCRQTVRVFDGRYRYDVKLTPKGTKAVKPSESRGFAGRARVCGVRHIPIAGHKPEQRAGYVTDPSAAEVWMLPAGGGLVYVPYRIVVPTVLGSAVLQATTVRVTLSNEKSLYLKN